MIEITQVAKERFLEVIKAEGREGHGLRVSVNGGGTPRPEAQGRPHHQRERQELQRIATGIGGHPHPKRNPPGRHQQQGQYQTGFSKFCQRFFNYFSITHRFPSNDGYPEHFMKFSQKVVKRELYHPDI